MQENSRLIKVNSLIMANAVALAYGIIATIGEGDTSKTIQGESISRDTLEQLAASRIVDILDSNV